MDAGCWEGRLIRGMSGLLRNVAMKSGTLSVCGLFPRQIYAMYLPYVSASDHIPRHVVALLGDMVEVKRW